MQKTKTWAKQKTWRGTRVILQC